MLHADPRRLLVRYDGALAITVIVAHAPCLSDHNDRDEVEKWWREFAALCQKFEDGNGVICCIDANAPLASHQTSLYGRDGAEKPNKQTYWFQSFLDQVKLAVPATLGFHVGPHHTWTHPKQKRLRRDYVLIAAPWLPFVSQSRTLQDFDTGLFHVDHVPAVLDLAGVAVGRIRHGTKIDAALVQSAEGQAHFQEALQTLPMPVWSMNVDQHSDYVHCNIMNIACQVFRSKTKKPRERPQLTEATINFINFKRQVLQMVRCASPEDVGPLLEQLREIEKEVRRKVRVDQAQWYDDWVRDIQASGELHDHLTSRSSKSLPGWGARKPEHLVLGHCPCSGNKMVEWPKTTRKFRKFFVVNLQSSKLDCWLMMPLFVSKTRCPLRCLKQSSISRLFQVFGRSNGL